MAQSNIHTKKPLLANLGQKMRGLFSSPKTPVMLSQKEQAKIIQIVQEFADTSRKELQDWQDALNQCNDIDNPSWNALQDLYDKLEPDAQLGISMEIRVAATLGKKFMIYDKLTKEEIPEKTELFTNKEWFFNFVWNMLDAIFKGYACAYLYDKDLLKFQYLPHRNIVPNRDFLFVDIGNKKGMSLEDKSIAERIIFVKYKKKYGILNDIVPNLIWKRNARQAWAEFAEKFGIPPIWATSTKSDPKTINAIETMLKQLGEAATAVLPAGTTVQVQDTATKGDPYNVYLKQIELDDQQIAKRLLGGTMITDSGSSYNQAQVHERTLKDVISLFDKMLITFVVNDKLMPMLAKFGFPFGENDAFKFDETESLPKEKLATIISTLSNNYDVEEKWLQDNLGIPLKRKDTTTAPNNPTNSFNQAPKIKAAALGANRYNVSACCHTDNTPTSLFTENLLDELNAILMNEVWEGNPTLVTEILASIKTHQSLMDGLLDGWSDRLQISYDTPDNLCLAMMEQNLFEFSRLKQKENVFKLNQLLIDKEANNIRSFKDFEEKALPYLENANRNWLRTEYNHAVAVGQNSSQYLKFKSEINDFPFIQIKTVGDTHVRISHKLLHNKIIDLRQGGVLLPPFAFGCRCYYIQYTGSMKNINVSNRAELLNILDLTEGSNWTINRADAKQVFTANEMYTKKLGIMDNTTNITHATYGLDGYATIKKTKPSIKLDETINSSNVGDLFKPKKGKDAVEIFNYINQNVNINQTTFSRATQTKEAAQLFPHVEKVLSKPDEVYLIEHSEGNYQKNYIKHYKNKQVIVNTSIGNNGEEVNNWYTRNDDSMRFGYLINKK